MYYQTSTETKSEREYGYCGSVLMNSYYQCIYQVSRSPPYGVKDEYIYWAHVVFLDFVGDPLVQFQILSLGRPAGHLDHEGKVADVQNHRH